MLLCIGASYAQIPTINPTFKSYKASNFTILETLDVPRAEKINKLGFSDSLVSDELFNQKTDGFTIADYSYYIDSYTLELHKLRDSISAYEERRLEAQLDAAGVLTDSIKINRARIILLRKRISKLRKEKNKKIRWLPSWEREQRLYFFKEFYNEDDAHTNYLNGFSLLFGSTTVQSELLSDYAGPFRFSFGTVITAESDDETEGAENPEADDESQENDLQRIINGGGNFYLTTQLPVYTHTDNTLLNLTSLNARIASDIEGVGADVETSDVKYGINLSSYLALTTDQKKFNFFVNAEYGWINGSGNFRDDFGLQDVFKKPAFIGKAIVGVMLDNKVTITVTSKSFSNYNSLVSEKVMVGIQLLN
ncbi:hypothetical protein GCM10007424_22560 [Flavobacterium suaedae]|uniref:DUF4349 domain-containing protein n=2 Tax=Flavobacterium suaedae TaxID=1767027 RepID=A0ABQ1JYC6_9FLAO|nr:hypothetical protein GCM10007424_22560 [Flavobacterium suaedae]